MPPASRGLRTFRTVYLRPPRINQPSSRPFYLQYSHYSVVRKLPPPLKEHERSSVTQTSALPNVQEDSPGTTSDAYPIKTPNDSVLRRIRSAFRRLTAPFKRTLQRYRAYWQPLYRFAVRSLPWIPPALLVLLHAPVQLMWVQGASMSPYLNTNWSNDQPNTEDRVLVAKYTEFTTAAKRARSLQPTSLQRGMIIVFNTPHNPERVAVKRIIGIPGDNIQPLPGYPGGTDPVIIPWNHLWVEGDADSREKSVDSNWYGPISKCLVVGRVTHVLGPWFWPGKVEWEKHKYPAQARVDQDAVRQVDPDVLAWKEAALAEYGDLLLHKMRAQPEQMEKEIRDPKGRAQLRSLLRGSKAEMERGDPESFEVASELANEAAKWLDKTTEVTRDENEEQQTGNLGPKHVDSEEEPKKGSAGDLKVVP